MIGPTTGREAAGPLRAHPTNPLFMDPYDGAVLGTPADTQWEPIRRALGCARRVADRVNLAAMQPRGDLASTQYCLADPGKEYLVYLPDGGEATVNLAAGLYRFEWLNPLTGTPAVTGSLTAGGGEQRFQAPFAGDAVLYLQG